MPQLLSSQDLEYSKEVREKCVTKAEGQRRNLQKPSHLPVTIPGTVFRFRLQHRDGTRTESNTAQNKAC